MIEVLSALAVVLGAIALLRWVLRWFGYGPAPGSARALRVVESCPLSARQRLVVVEADGERLLLAAGEGPVTLLRRLGPVAVLPPAGQEEDRVEAVPVPEAQPPRRPLRLARGWLRALGMALWVAGMLLSGAETATAQSVGGASGVSLSLEGATEPDRIASTLQIVALVTLISVAPSLLLMATCFTRVVIVLSLLRQALGIHQLPPNQVIVGLALFTTFFVMAPVGNQIKTEALDPYIAGELDEGTAIQKALAPVRAFMATHTREKDLALFVEMSEQPPPESVEDVSLSTLMPSFLISEIRKAFEIGFMIYLPFLIVDIVIASMLISMGMIVLPPIIISLPFKLMLFVLLDGWNLVLSSLVMGLR